MSRSDDTPASSSMHPDAAGAAAAVSVNDGKELGLRVRQVAAQCEELRALDGRLVTQADALLFRWLSLYAHAEAGVPPPPDPEQALAELRLRLDLLAVACQGYARLRELRREEARAEREAAFARQRSTVARPVFREPRAREGKARRVSTASTSSGGDPPREAGDGDDRPRRHDLAARVAAEVRQALTCRQCGAEAVQDGLLLLCPTCLVRVTFHLRERLS